MDKMDNIFQFAFPHDENVKLLTYVHANSARTFISMQSRAPLLLCNQLSAE